MPALLLTPPAPHPSASAIPWPRRWPDQRNLLEQQHDRLEGLLAQAIECHCRHEKDLGPAEFATEQASCARLLRLLILHLRLEERWLARWGSLCDSHGASHRQVARDVTEDWQRDGQHHTARLQWLMDLQAWFNHHRHSADAIAYACAASATTPSMKVHR
ncbi:hypothetical protein KBY66_10720 [Synechococcus sp. Tobar12-5m-g]|uniref:hypothetical protein n=1 Tax=unclassified Synechococcus TaxID=2626047 RepID=UPI0020CEC581|nr:MULTISPECIES: hypothetical protein [unclassified Synechococcus]MCP9773095.1 hypothetical protein [Synechococcus sp. Tobar12-5m-g]MCP9873933.1 hypothetical protein [Synechococcus sp. Cruz CV-v-12]